jgi:uncharacterized integral membrane protein
MTLEKLEEMIARDRRCIFTVLAIVSTIAMLINSITLSSPMVGTVLTTIYLLINSIFLGNLFFKEESANFRVILGSLVLLMIMALEGSSLIILSSLFTIIFDVKAAVVILNLATVAIWLMRHVGFAKLLRFKTV